MSKKIIRGFKGFNRDMTCRGFQYEEGKEYDTPEAEVCEKGFHFCENPIDVLSYYAPGQSIYHEVEGSGGIDQKKDGDTKVACTHIKIGARITIPMICRAMFEYVKSKCTNENNAEPGKPATAGDYGAATAGYSGAATAGYKGAATAGYKGAATAGDNGAATAGDSGAATAGDNGAATSRGKTKVGKNGVATVRGNGVMICGGLGALLVIAEENTNNYDIKEWKAVVVDGEKIKADTWYRLENGKLKEVKEDENQSEE